MDAALSARVEVWQPRRVTHSRWSQSPSRHFYRDAAGFVHYRTHFNAGYVPKTRIRRRPRYPDRTIIFKKFYPHVDLDAGDRGDPHDHAPGPMRRRSDHLYPRTRGPRELEALRLIEQRPGITVAELAEEMGVTMQRAWQYVGRLEAGRRSSRAVARAAARSYPC